MRLYPDRLGSFPRSILHALYSTIRLVGSNKTIYIVFSSAVTATQMCTNSFSNSNPSVYSFLPLSFSNFLRFSASDFCRFKTSSLEASLWCGISSSLSKSYTCCQLQNRYVGGAWRGTISPSSSTFSPRTRNTPCGTSQYSP